MSNLFTVTTLRFGADQRAQVNTAQMYEEQLLEFLKESMLDTSADADVIITHQVLLVGNGSTRRLEMQRVYPKIVTTERLVIGYQPE